MKQLAACALLTVGLVFSALSQAPSVQLKAKQSSGLFGLGGPKFVQLELSNKLRVAPLSCENVNESDQFYFLCTPVGDWQIDVDFVTENLAALAIVQGDKRHSVESSGEVVGGTVLLGFSKSVQLNETLDFVLQSGDSVYRGSMNVPQEFWPGATAYAELERKVQDALAAGQHRVVIALTESILKNPDFSIFPTFAAIREHRTSGYEIELSNTVRRMESLTTGDPSTLKSRIPQLATITPDLAFVRDSLPRPDLQVLPTDPRVAALLSRIDVAFQRQAVIKDSMQRAQDDYSIRWILEGSINGKNSVQFQDMIEALAAAFSTLDPMDTSRTKFQVSLPVDFATRLNKSGILDSYETFVRICRDRHAKGESLFPPGFLPNLRRDSAAFTQPYYSMLKATGEYFSGAMALARTEIIPVLRACTVPELIARYDLLRANALMREFPPHPDALSMLETAKQRLEAKDTIGVMEAGKQLGFIAPTFAYGSFAFGMFYRQMGDPLRAQFAFQKAYQLDTLFLSAYLETYYLHLSQQTFAPAVDVLQTALLRGNDSWIVRFNLGSVYLAMNEAAKAIPEFEKALGFNKKSYDTHIKLGQAYQSLKNYSKAKEAYDEALGIDTMRQEALDRMKQLYDLIRTQK